MSARANRRSRFLLLQFRAEELCPKLSPSSDCGTLRAETVRDLDALTANLGFSSNPSTRPRSTPSQAHKLPPSASHSRSGWRQQITSNQQRPGERRSDESQSAAATADGAAPSAKCQQFSSAKAAGDKTAKRSSDVSHLQRDRCGGREADSRLVET